MTIVAIPIPFEVMWYGAITFFHYYLPYVDGLSKVGLALLAIGYEHSLRRINA